MVQLQGTLKKRKYELRQRNFSLIRATEIISMLNGKLEETQKLLLELEKSLREKQKLNTRAS